ncbi:MAG: endonuclease III domain-containing protein [Terriglobales bacterium]
MAAATLQPYLEALQQHFAPELDLERWWPGRSRFEVMAGALLVQNTAWDNAARALEQLRRAGKLSPAGVRSLSEAELGELIRSAGTWRLKARRLKGLVAWLDAAHGGSLARLFAQPAAAVREQLLDLEGIGEETADAMLLFAGRQPSFVIDAYTRRIFARHRLPAERDWIASALPASERNYRYLHAMLVETGKRYCRKQAPDCGACPLQASLPAALPPEGP